MLDWLETGKKWQRQDGFDNAEGFSVASGRVQEDMNVQFNCRVSLDRKFQVGGRSRLNRTNGVALAVGEHTFGEDDDSLNVAFFIRLDGEAHTVLVVT